MPTWRACSTDMTMACAYSAQEFSWSVVGFVLEVETADHHGTDCVEQVQDDAR